MPEQKILAVVVKPGDLAGEKYIFQNEADESLRNRIPGDIIFMLKDKPSNFKRDGYNLIINYDVGEEFIRQRLFNQISPEFTFKIKSITGEEIAIDFKSDMKILCSKGKGMPVLGSSGTRGDLLIYFENSEDAQIIRNHEEDADSLFPIEKIDDPFNQMIDWRSL